MPAPLAGNPKTLHAASTGTLLLAALTGALPLAALAGALLLAVTSPAAALEGDAGARERAAVAGPAFRVTEERAPCRDRDALRRPFFGDTHVHTGYSQDASTQGTRATPRDAYAFARGEPLGVQPFDANGRPGRTLQLDRPIDFAVVTDHAEQIGEVHLCKTPGAPGHGSIVCRIYRSFPRVAFFLMNAAYQGGGDRWGFCGEDDRHCLDAARTIWTDTQEAAEGAYDRSEDCRFTSFVGYEWTASSGTGNNLHRNVIFRNAQVPALPVSVMETGNTAADLWDQLQQHCVDGVPGCEVITIPHNSNLDGGLMFQSAAETGGAIGSEEAARRARWEPLLEVMQHKGDSECMLGGDTTDEACGFEKLPYDSFGGNFLGNASPAGPHQFLRHALREGLRLERRLGHNPFRYGVVASTDTHLGAAGLVSERGFPGHGGAGAPADEEIPPGLTDNLEFGPGGLAVLWAEENSRDALFEAMQRRETYGTSGPRIAVRFFGGYGYEPSLCGSEGFVASGYAGGTPMGGSLTPDPEGRAPRFAVWALRDPGSEGDPGTPLQRIQIVKGWLDAAGTTHERVVEAAGGPNGATVDLRTCEPRGVGAEDLCTVWTDPDFDPSVAAFYYARVLENPTCRWSQRLCNEGGVDCSDPATIGEGFAPCCSADHQPAIQERAWTSPIWYDPPRAAAERVP